MQCPKHFLDGKAYDLFILLYFCLPRSRFYSCLHKCSLWLYKTKGEVQMLAQYI